MTSDDTPTGRGSRARTGGSARPLTSGSPGRTARRDGVGAATPPSFAPGTGAGRPPSASDAVAVGGGTRTPGRPTRPATPRPARPATPTPSDGNRRVPARPGAGDEARPAPVRTPAPRADRSTVPGRPPAVRPATPAPGRRPAGDEPVVVAGRSTPTGAAPARTARTTGARPPVGRPPVSPSPSSAGTRPGPARPAPAGTDTPRVSRRRLVAAGLALVLVLAIAWPIALLIWADGRLTHVDALSGAAGTDGTTYLLTGSDSRADGAIEDPETTGQRSDTMMLLHQPASGPAALLSLPRDTYVEIPGQGPGKLNAAYSAGGAPLLVQTVEGLTGMTVDHYVEVGFAGFEQIVDAVGGVNLCSDLTVDDKDSGMVWTPGCHDVGGTDALAFARMRKADPDGDIGRAERQQQLIASISTRVQDPGLLLKPGTQVALLRSGTGALTVSDGTGMLDLGRMALAFRAANGPDGITGTPPISDVDYRPGGVGSAVRLDPDLAPGFFAAIRDGSQPAGPVGGMPTP